MKVQVTLELNLEQEDPVDLYQAHRLIQGLCETNPQLDEWGVWIASIICLAD